MANGTKEALADALRQMMKVKPIDKITVKDIVEVCGVNRQTFKEVVYEHWLEDVMTFMDYLEKNSDFTLNVYNSNSRLYMLRYLKAKMKACIESFAVIVSEGKNIERQDFEFITEFYATCAIGFISQWMDGGMQMPREMTRERILKVMDQSVENIINRFAEQMKRE